MCGSECTTFSASKELKISHGGRDKSIYNPFLLSYIRVNNSKYLYNEMGVDIKLSYNALSLLHEDIEKKKKY